MSFLGSKLYSSHVNSVLGFKNTFADKAIAKTLSKFRYIATAGNANSKLEELKSSIPTDPDVQVKEQNTFTDSIKKSSAKKTSNQPQLRFAGFSKDWKRTKLGDLVSITTGKVNLDEADENGKYNFYTCGIKVFKTNAYAFEGPAITIVGNGASIGYMHLADNKFNAYQRTYVLQDFKADRGFIFNVIKKPLDKKIKMESRVGVIPYIVLDMLTDLYFHLPEEREQQKVGNFFKDIDEKIKSLNNSINDLVKLKSSLGQKVFPRGDNKKPELRFSGFNSDWKRTTLKDFCTWSKGSDLKKDKLNFEGKGDLALHYGDLFALKGYIPKESLLTYTEYDEGVYIPTNSLLFPDSDVTPLGLATASTIDTPNVRASGGVIIGAIKDNNVDSSFIAVQLVCNKEKFYPFITGTTVRHINPKGLGAIKVLIPSLEEQRKISNLFKELDVLERKLIKQKANYEVLKRALLQRMFV